MIETVIEQRRRDLGGFEVGRVLPYPGHRMVGPFVFFDAMGPVDLQPGLPRSVDVRPHPHIGLATVTYLFDGEIMHRDSVGSEQPIRPAEVNWMVAGRGITHSERFERARAQGDRVHGIQAWVALPAEHEETEPSFSHHSGDGLPSADDAGVKLRLIAGELLGLKAAAATHSPLFYAHADLAAGTAFSLPAQYAERAAYIVSGRVEIDGASFLPDRMLVFGAADAVTLRAAADTRLMLLGGEPVGPRYIEWNFVSSSQERIEQAKADWRAGRMKLPDLDRGEFIPLPGDPAPPANPMS